VQASADDTADNCIRAVKLADTKLTYTQSATQHLISCLAEG